MTEQDVAVRRAFVVLNPVAGRTTPDAVTAALEQAFPANGWAYQVYQTQPEDDVRSQVRRALEEGCDIVVAAGGDGTVSMVADALVGSDVPLGIIPAGSANVLALELGIPGTIPEAVALLAGDHTQRQLDMMKLGEQHFILQIGVGLDALMIQDTDREAKRALGRWAYMRTLARNMFGFESPRFTIVVDGKRLRPRAAQVLVANAGTLGAKPLTWGEHIQPHDGHLDLCVVKVRTLVDYPRVIYQFLSGRHPNSANIAYQKIFRSATIASDRPLPVQADGEIIGTTPITVSVVPKAVRVVVPHAAQASPIIGIMRRAGQAQQQGEDGMTQQDEQAAQQTQRSIEQALRSIRTPEQADKVIDDLEQISKGVSERAVAQQVPTPENAKAAAEQVEQAAQAPAEQRPQAVIGEVAAQIAAAPSPQDQEALSKGVQQATQPGAGSPAAPTQERQLLQEALLRRLGPLRKLDTAAFLAINSLPHPPLADAFFIGLTTAFNRGDAWAAGLIAASLRDSRQREVLREVLPALWLTAATVEGPIKQVFRRQRPFISVVRAVVVGRKPGNYSFPSGHSAAAFGGAYLLARHHPRLAPLLFGVAGLVGFSRVYLGAHYPGDVVSGAGVGMALAELFRLVGKGVKRRIRR